MTTSLNKTRLRKTEDKKKCAEMNIALEEKTTHENMTVEDKLRNLYHLQLVLSEIDGIRTFRGELPFEVQDLKDEVAGLSIRIDNFQKSLSDYQKQISQEKIKITNANILIGKYKEQITKVRSNREYDSLSKKIENQELDIQLAEKHILDFQEEVHLLENEIQNNQQFLRERQMDLQDKEVELEKIISETQFQEEQLGKQIQQIETLIETRLLTSFKKLRKNMKNGLAVVCIQRDACGGCFNKIPPQRQMEIKMRKKIILCEHCGRIIIDPMLTEGVK